MKKKMIMLAGLLIVAAALLAVYGIAKNKPKDEPAADPGITENAGEDLIDVISYAPEDIESIKITTDKEIKFLVSDKGIEIENVDLSLMKQDLVSLMFNALIAVRSDNKVGEFDDLGQFGLNSGEAAAAVEYTTKKGNETLYIGEITPDNSYYYAKKASDGIVYTIDKTVGDRIMQDITAMADLGIDILDSKGLAKLEVKQKNREDLLVSFEKENEKANENLDKSGLQTLVMHKPIENLLVYPYNLETGLLYNYDKFVIEKMVELGNENFAKYGLDDPQMTILMADTENGVALSVGNLDETGESYYVCPNGQRAVYTMPKAALEPFFNYNIIDFIQKFISLHFRDTVESIDIKSVYGNYTVEFKEEGENKIIEENGVKKDKRKEYIGGKNVDSDAFADYYELLTGLTFDALDESAPQGEPQAVITYKMLDGKTDTTVFYNYDDTFFLAQKEGSDMNMLVTKQQVKQAIEKADKLPEAKGGIEG